MDLTIELDNLTERNTYRLNNKIPYTIRNLLGDGVWLAGGAIRSVFDKTPVQDYDLYFNSQKAKDKTVHKLLSTYKGKVLSETKKHKVLTVDLHGLKVQAIDLKYYDTGFGVINDFDFKPSMFAMDSENLYTNSDAIRSATKMQLRFHSLQTPVSTIRRIMKYRDKGYSIPVKFVKEFVEACKASKDEDLNWDEFIDEVDMDLDIREAPTYVKKRPKLRMPQYAQAVVGPWVGLNRNDGWQQLAEPPQFIRPRLRPNLHPDHVNRVDLVPGVRYVYNYAEDVAHIEDAPQDRDVEGALRGPIDVPMGIIDEVWDAQAAVDWGAQVEAAGLRQVPVNVPNVGDIDRYRIVPRGRI